MGLSCFLSVKHVTLSCWLRAHVGTCLVLWYAWSLLFCMKIPWGRSSSTRSKLVSNSWFWESLFCSRNRNPTCRWWTKNLSFTKDWSCQPPVTYRVFFSSLERFSFSQSCLFWSNILWRDIWLWSKIIYWFFRLNLHALFWWFLRVD